MRYSLTYLSSTGRMFLVLLGAGALLASCERSPTDFGGTTVTSELPLKKVTLDSLSQYVLIIPPQPGPPGKGISIPPPYDEEVKIELEEGQGKLTDGEDGLRLTMHFASDVPMEDGFGSTLEAATGYTLQSFSMDMQVTPTPADSAPHLTQNHCATSNATLSVTRREYGYPPERLTIPIEVTIDGLVEKRDEHDEPYYEGRLHLFTFFWPDNREDLFIYDLQATIRIE